MATPGLTTNERLLEEAARDVWEVAGNGMIVTTDPVTGSTHLVGFFIPTWQMNRLGKELGEAAMLRSPRPNIVSEQPLFRYCDDATEGEMVVKIGGFIGAIVIGIILLAWFL